MRTVKCKSCKKEFEPIMRNGIIASRLCIDCLVKKGKEKRKKLQRKDKKEAKEKLKTHSEHLADLQRVFNKYIRLRDKGKPCISCGRPLKGKYHAGHFYSVGSHPNLRFNENNVHGQCIHCNLYKHGNVGEYKTNLPERIGKEEYEELERNTEVVSKMTIPEIKDKIHYYRELIKSMT